MSTSKFLIASVAHITFLLDSTTLHTPERLQTFLIDDSLPSQWWHLGDFPGRCLDTSLESLAYLHPPVWDPFFFQWLPWAVLVERGSWKPRTAAPLLHVIFIRLIKANLIKAGIAEMCKSSSEHGSRPYPKRGPLSPSPGEVACWALGHHEEDREVKTKEGSLWGKLDLHGCADHS